MWVEWQYARRCPVPRRLQVIETGYLYSLPGCTGEPKEIAPIAPWTRSRHPPATRSCTSSEPSREAPEGYRRLWRARRRRGAAPRRPLQALIPRRCTGWFAGAAFVPLCRVPRDRHLPQRQDKAFAEEGCGGQAACVLFQATSSARAKRIAGIRVRDSVDKQG